MKRFICLLMCLCFLNLTSCKSYNTNNLKGVYERNDHKKKEDASVIKASLLSNLNQICSNPREYGTEGEEKAFKFLTNKLKEYGYTITCQDFLVYKQTRTDFEYADKFFIVNPYNSKPLGKSKNIIAKVNNYNKNKKNIYITAHYDTTSETLGNIDNGSGVCVVLEVAKQLKSYDGPYNIIFVLFGAEENLLSGSRVFVSKLTDEEKKNTIGCINIDMVGEKNAGGVALKTGTAEHNILTVMFNKLLNIEPSISSIGTSDEMSFYFDKIPSMTLKNKSPHINLKKLRDQSKYINLDELNYVTNLVCNFIIKFDIDSYEKFLNGDIAIVSNVIKSDRDVPGFGRCKDKVKVPSGFKLTNVNAKLIENGYDAKTEFVYKNKDGKTFIISEKRDCFDNPSIYSSFKPLKVNDLNGSCYFVNTDPKSDLKVSYYLYGRLGEIKGDISPNDALKIIKEYYKEA